MIDEYPFSAWCPLKAQTYLHKSGTKSCSFKYIWPFSGHQALKGYIHDALPQPSTENNKYRLKNNIKKGV